MYVNIVLDVITYIYIYMLAPPKNLPFARFYWYLQCFQCLAQDKFDSVIWAILRHAQIWVDRRWENISRIIDNFPGYLQCFDWSQYFRIDTWESNSGKINTALWPNSYFQIYIAICSIFVVSHQTWNLEFQRLLKL